MKRQEQYEIWIQSGIRKWEMLASFLDLDIASSLARGRNGRTRLICVKFESGKLVSQELVEEVGYTPLLRRTS